MTTDVDPVVDRPARPAAGGVRAPARTSHRTTAGPAAPRVLSLLLVTGLAAGAVVAAQRVDLAPVTAPAPQTLPVTPSAAVPVCPGPEPLQAPEGGRSVAPSGDTVVGAVAVPQDALGADGALALGPVAATLRSMLPDGEELGRRPGENRLSGAADRAGVVRSRIADSRTTSTAVGPLRLDADRSGQVPAVAATQVTLARSGDLRGLSAVGCGIATTDTWLVGGGTTSGRRARLLLANPAPSPAVVDVRVLGPDGPVAAPNGTGIVVAAGAQTTVLLDALAPDLSAVALHVVARSGRVAATLHDELVRGLTPGGTDSVTASVPPSRRQVVPGLSLPAGALPDDASAAGAVALRVAVPGSQDAVVRVRVLGPDGAVDLPSAVATVAAGTVKDLAVTGVRPGTYTAVVEADAPVVASALIGRARVPEPSGGTADVPDVLPTDDKVADLAWAPSAAALDGPAVVAVPTLDGMRATLVLGALGAARVAVVPLDGTGSPGEVRTVDVGAGRTATVDLPADAAGVLLRPVVGAVHPALLLTAADEKGPLVSSVAVRSAVVTSTGGAPVVAEDVRAGLGR